MHAGEIVKIITLGDGSLEIYRKGSLFNILIYKGNNTIKELTRNREVCFYYAVPEGKRPEPEWFDITQECPDQNF